ncbi:MAG: CBS domain-containing protein [Thiotrichales bacterium]
MNLEQIMSRRVVSVSPDDQLSLIRHLFEKTGFHHLLVVEENELAGIISDRDLFKAISPNLGTPAETPKDTATLHKRAHQIMSRHPVYLKPADSVYTAIDVFNEHAISGIPILDDAEHPVGIVSWRDIMKVLAKNRPSQNH